MRLRFGVRWQQSTRLQSRTDKTYAFVTVSQLAAIHGITLEPGVVYNGLTDEVAQQIADGSYSPTEFT